MKVTRKKISKAERSIVHNPGKLNERREPYWVVTSSAVVSVKKVKLKVCTFRRINSYSVAYGNYSKAKTIKIR